jgi:hypothetical protein
MVPIGLIVTGRIACREHGSPDRALILISSAPLAGSALTEWQSII